MTVSTKALRAVAAFIPSNIARKLAQGENIILGEEISGTGVALFADIAGFTPMAERLVNLMETTGSEGHRGAEELTRIINQAFTVLIRAIHRHGGVVTRFSGDALSAWFQAPAPQNPQVVIQRALRCAAEMQAAIVPLNPTTVEKEIFPISVKIGLGYGPAVTIFLGESGKFMEVVLAGPSLDAATQAEHHAYRGDTIVSPEILRHLPDLDCTVLDGGYARLNTLSTASHLIQMTPDILKDIPVKAHPAFLERLAPFLPQTIYKRTLITEGDIPGDYRRVSSIFVLFEGLDFTQTGVGKKFQAYIGWAYQTVARFQGTLLRVLTGDKGSALHITFGAPDQHPNDIERALRCALTLRDDPNRPAFIVNQRIGIGSGLVFTAAIGSPERREYTVMGDEINLSSRLMSVTDPETILVDDYSRQRTAGQFEFAALPPLTLKGKAEPISAYHLIAERPQETSLEARLLASRWPIVGREEELADFAAAANRALQSKGQVIALSGRLGVGKTRLIEEVVRDWVENNGIGFVGQASQHLQNNPYHVWIGFWQDFFGLSTQTPADKRREKVAALISQLAPDMALWADTLNEILGIPVAPDSPIFTLKPEDRQKKLVQLTLALLQARAKTQPLLILFDDLHWADEVSVRLIDELATRIATAPILLCLLFRSTHHVPVEAIALPHCTWRTLEDLDAVDSEALIMAILGRVEISARIMREIFDKTQGTPLYVEEIINNLIATNALKRDGEKYVFTDSASLARTPDTLQDLIRARLDRLETETRDLAQVAAVINREFSFSLLHNVYPYPMGAVQMKNRMDQLRFNDITTLTRPEPNPNYFFKHALAYEIAYNSLAFARRQVLHKKIAATIEAEHKNRLDEDYSLLAYHYHQANMPHKAFAFAIKAGRRAQAFYANQIAMQHFTQAEMYLQSLKVDDHWEDAIQLYLNRAQLHRLNVDMAAADADLNRAISLAKIYDDSRSRAQGHNLKAEFGYYQEQTSVIRQEATQALNLVKSDLYSQEKATALFHLGVAELMNSHFEAATQYLQQAQTMAAQHGYQALESETINKLATVQFFDGHLERALQAYQKVHANRQQLGLKDKEAETLSNIATLQFRLNHPNQALQTAEQAIQRAQEAGWNLLIPYVKLLQVELLTYLGLYEQAETKMGEIYPLFAAEDEVGNAYAKLAHGREILLDLNRLDEAETMLNDVLTVTQKYGIYEEMSRTLVSLGAVNSRQKRWKQAEDYFLQAHDICTEHHAGWYLSEIYAHLAEALIKQDKLSDARKAVQAGMLAIRNRSNPDWSGSLLALNADIARRQNQPNDDVASLYLNAANHAKARSRAIIRHRLLIRVGTQLLAYPNPQTRHAAESLIREGMGWFKDHSSDML